MGFQARLPLPLPRQLVVFGLGDWSCYSADTSIAVDVLVSPGIAPQRVGTLEPTRRLQQELLGWGIREKLSDFWCCLILLLLSKSFSGLLVLHQGVFI